MRPLQSLFGGGAALALMSQVSLAAPFNTALSQTEIGQIMDRHCALERGYAARVANPEEWGSMLRVANRVLAENRDIVAIKRMIDDAERLVASGDRVQRELAQFQICLLANKIAYAEAHERRAKK